MTCLKKVGKCEFANEDHQPEEHIAAVMESNNENIK